MSTTLRSSMQAPRPAARASYAAPAALEVPVIWVQVEKLQSFTGEPGFPAVRGEE